MTQDTLIHALNGMLEQEHACIIRYLTHAAIVSGPYADTVAARLREIAGDEMIHAEKLRARITALNGSPSMQVATADLIEATKLTDIIQINIEEERGAVKKYTEILKSVPETNVILHQTLLEIIRDEQEHFEELSTLAETL